MKSIFTLSFVAVLFLTSCSEKIVGTWNVQKFETIKPGEQNISLNNIGTITFNKNNTGEKSLYYNVLGVETKDDVPFKWNLNEPYITIESENSSIAKTWILIENNRKSQKWKSTDGSNEIQTLELTK
ncbi:MAG TPA: hypothetical protein PLL09_03980 [Flavobacterium sp.]|uniref:hypothetical protein n=1 Tax=unclassified Flavobacterium TaxID=196869 RepID=UPI0025BC7536|nr:MULTISPECIES: hypothetical protein [unclassified Flavobacterium]HRE76965.1 hypothetical protein [Flavobacterium sp.]